MNKKICLIGNPNCGKTTLFNVLTNTHQKTGNWTGVTVESKDGRYRYNKDITIIDLPGLYSLSPYAQDEKVVIDYLKQNKPDAVINVVDGTNLERNLFLTCSLHELNIPVVMAVNFSDELDKNGIKINTKNIESFFGISVVLISAKKNKNIKTLMDIAVGKTELPLKLNDTQNGSIKLIEKNINRFIEKRQTKSEKSTIKADKLFLHKIFGIPVFFLIITFIYYCSITVGGYFSKIIDNLIFKSEIAVKVFLTNKLSDWLLDLICNGIIKGIGTVVSFLPQVLVLYALITVVEESGYANRITFIFDKILSKFGLGGKSLISFVLSCGCSVSGIMATKTIESKNERLMTVFLTPFMPCGAKLVVFGWFSYSFFNGNPLVATSMYFISIFAILVFGKLLKLFKPFNNNESEFLMEMPLLRMPSAKNILIVLWKKTKEFLLKAGSIVFVISVLLWVLYSFGIHGYTDGNIQNSFLYIIGNIIKYVFYPLGIGSWECSVAILSGILAKEGVIETLSMLNANYSEIFKNQFVIYSFMTFVLLSPPCIASIITAKKQINDNKMFVFMLIFQFLSAYSLSLVINLIGNLITLSLSLILSITVGIIIFVITIMLLLRCTRCKNCNLCRGDFKCRKE